MLTGSGASNYACVLHANNDNCQRGKNVFFDVLYSGEVTQHDFEYLILETSECGSLSGVRQV